MTCKGNKFENSKILQNEIEEKNEIYNYICKDVKD
jgi:hypothetical protein